MGRLFILQHVYRVEYEYLFLNTCGDYPKPILKSIVTEDET